MTLHLTSCEYDPPRDKNFALQIAAFIASNPPMDLTLRAQASVDTRAMIVAALRAYAVE